jgi:hypothetical protein
MLIQSWLTLAQETSSLQWMECFLNGFIVTVCSAFLIRRCWKVSLLSSMMADKMIRCRYMAAYEKEHLGSVLAGRVFCEPPSREHPHGE